MMSRFALYLSLVFLFAACQQNTNTPSQSATDGFSRKHEPVDANLDLRLGVRGDFSLEAYVDGLRSATQNLSPRSRPEGFDEAWEVEGPFTEGGRINALAIDPRNSDIVYIAFSRGGLWRTTNHGENWSPLSDGLPFPSIATIAFDTISDRIWIGTGDPNISGYFFIGDGVYYSDDNGATWVNSGLAETGIVSEIQIDPRNPDVLYAATMGKPYTPNEDKGLYKSIDRGLTWNKILFGTVGSGISSIHIHPTNPDILYATGWDRIRNLYESVVAGNNSILWKSIDGGQTWQDLQPAVGYSLPEGRLGFAIAKSDPDRLYLSVTNEASRFGGLYRSDNGGESWQLAAAPMNTGSTGLNQSIFGGFGWFFGQTRVDPNDPDHLWMLGVDLWESSDGGYTWNRDNDTDDFRGLHADKHALEVASDGTVWVGTDGGVYKRNLLDLDWVDTEDLPTNLIYRVADNPFDTTNYACGMQDNGTSLGGDAPAPQSWSEYYGGDGFQAVISKTDTTTILAESQFGNIVQVDLASGGVSFITPFSQLEQKNWDTPIASMYDESEDVTYLLTGSVFGYEGEYNTPPYWESNQQLLTSTDEDRYRVVSAAHIADDKTCYIGTSEGWVWKKQLFEGDWTRINTGFDERYVTDITTSSSDPNTVYLTMSEYRSGNSEPYVLRSADAGATWSSLQGDLPRIAVNAILSIPNMNDSMLMLATDAGVYGSLDRGASYHRLGIGMTNVPVFDLAYDEASTRLVAGTFGRSLQTYPLKNLRLVDGTSSIVKGATLPKIERELLAYPNPTSGSICLEATLLEVSRGSLLELINLNGQVMQSWEFAAGQRKLKPCIDIKDGVANGQYIFRLKNRHDVQLAKVVLER